MTHKHSGWTARDRAMTHGASCLSLAELLCVILSINEEQAEQLLSTCAYGQENVLQALHSASAAEVRQVLTPARTTTLLAAIELGRRVYREVPDPSPIVDNPRRVAEVLGTELSHSRVEKFAVLALSTKNVLIAKEVVTVGTLDETIAHPREVFRLAVRVGAAGIICAHNHPSGNTNPSPADLQLTQQLLDAGRVLQIPLLDHVVIGRDEFTSLRKNTALWR